MNESAGRYVFERQRRLADQAVRVLAAAVAVGVRPHLWWVAARQVMRVARPRWWRRAPFLPLPEPEYVRFRLETAYGEIVVPRSADLVAYLQWCADSPRVPARERPRRRR
ncbi:MAG TPA: hypothetical protein VK771_09220 [Acidimicrobiia bacterium]|nr:hypothetical protein [Acidimicrobiia bacterium]